MTLYVTSAEADQISMVARPTSSTPVEVDLRQPAHSRGLVPAHGSARRKLAGSVVAAAVVTVFACWLKLRVGGIWTVRDFDDAVTALAALAACLCCLRAGLASSRKLRRFWLLLSLALAAWTMAEVIWGVYDVILRVPVPVPSWADLGYLGAIPLAAAAILFHPALQRSRAGATRIALDGAVLAMALLFLSWSSVLGPLWRHTDLSSLGGVVAIAYPFGDIVMLFLVVLVVRHAGGAGRFGLWCILSGLVAMALSDSTYTYLVETGRYSSGDLIDTGWVVAYLAIGLGAFASIGEDASSPAHARASTGDLPLSSAVVPFVPVLIALTALAIENLAGERLRLSDWVMALALTVLVLVRQAVELFDRWSAAGRAGEQGRVQTGFSGP